MIEVRSRNAATVLYQKSQIAATIKEQISMPAAVAMYAPESNAKHGRIPCPIHSGKDYNLSFDDKLYHCFVCGVGGDVISFVRHLFGLDFQQALSKLNDDFGLGLPVGRKPTLRETRELNRAYNARLEAEKEQQARYDAWQAEYERLLDEYARFDCNLRDYAPRAPCDKLHPLFSEALSKIGYVTHCLKEYPEYKER